MGIVTKVSSEFPVSQGCSKQPGAAHDRSPALCLPDTQTALTIFLSSLRTKWLCKMAHSLADHENAKKPEDRFL